MMYALLTNTAETKVWCSPFPCQMKPRTKIAVVSTEEEIRFYFHCLTYVPPKSTCLYLMRDDRSRLFKIGISKNPEYRERTLQSDNPMVTLLAYWVAVDASDEKVLHKHFQAYRMRGEWFALTPRHIRQIGAYFERSPDVVGDQSYTDIISQGIRNN